MTYRHQRHYFFDLKSKKVVIFLFIDQLISISIFTLCQLVIVEKQKHLYLMRPILQSMLVHRSTDQAHQY